MNITAEDHALVRSHVLLTLVLAVFERDRVAIMGVVKTPEPYGKVLDNAIRAATAELKSVRATMRTRGIKIYEEDRSERLYARFQCRGYHSDFGMLHNHARLDVEALLAKLLNV